MATDNTDPGDQDHEEFLQFLVDQTQELGGYDDQEDTHCEECKIELDDDGFCPSCSAVIEFDPQEAEDGQYNKWGGGPDEEDDGEPEPPKIEGIVTSCRDCVFAEYHGNEQQGCQWDRLDKFEANGGEVVGQDDSFKRYLLVVGRYCNANRHFSWAEDKPKQDLYAIVAREFAVRVNFIVYADAHSTREQVVWSLLSILDQGTIKPFGITLVLNGVSDDIREYLKIVRDLELSVPWEVRNVVPNEDGSQPAYGKAMDLTLIHVKEATFYTVGRAGYRWSSNFLTVINQAINYEMIRCVALLPDDDGNGLVMSVNLHNNLLKGNRGGSVVDKVLEVAQEEQTGHMVKTWEDLKDAVAGGWSGPCV